jgi:hypothetical protein
MGSIHPLEWFPEDLNWSGFRDAPTGLNEEHRGTLQDIDDYLPFTQPTIWVTEICLQLFDKQCWLTERGYDCNGVHVESQLEVAGRQRHVDNTQTE